MTDVLYLKWGTYKGGRFVSPAAQLAFRAYADCGAQSMSRMAHRDSEEQTEKLVALIEAVAESGGQIYNDWSGETYTKEQTVEYVTSYHKS